MKGTRFLAFLLAFVLAFSSIGVADVSAAETLSGNQVTEETLSGNEVKPEDVQEPVEEVVEDKIVTEEVTVKNEAMYANTDYSIGLAPSKNGWWMYEDEEKVFEINKDNLPEDGNYQIGVAIGYINEDKVFVGLEDQTGLFVCDSEKTKITLYGEELNKHKDELPEIQGNACYWIYLSVTDSNEELLCDYKSEYIDIFPVRADYNFPFAFPESNKCLIGESKWINRSMWVNYENAENPYGNGKEVQIKDVEAVEHYTWNENGEEVPSNQPIFFVHEYGGENWELNGRENGFTKFKITYETFDGEDSSYDLELYSLGEYYEIRLEFQNDTNCMHRGESRTVETNVIRRFVDENGNHREEDAPKDYRVVFDGTAGDRTEVSYDSMTFSVDGSSINVQASEENYGDEEVVIRIDGPENAYAEWTMFGMDVTDCYFNLLPSSMENIPVGDTINMSELLTLYLYEEGKDPVDVLKVDPDRYRLIVGSYNDAWKSMGDDELVPTLKRVKAYGGEIGVWGQYLDDDGNWGNVSEKNYWFNDMDYSVDMKMDRDWIYTDEVITYEFNTDNLNTLNNAKIVARIGYFEPNRSEDEPNPPVILSDDVYELNEANGKYALTLYGEKISEKLPEGYDSFWVFYSVCYQNENDDIIVFEENKEIGIRNPWENYNLPDEWISLLLGDDQFISRNMYVDYENKENPFGNWTKVEITGIETLRHREYCDVSEEWKDGKRPTAKSIVFLSENEDGWQLYGEDHGETDFLLTYIDIHGEKKEYNFTASSTGDQILLQLDTPDDYIRMLPNSEECYEVEVVRRYIDLKDNQHQETLSANNISFRIDEENTAATKDDDLASYSVSGNNLIVIKTKEDVSGDSWFDVNATISYIDIYGNEQEQGIGRGYRLEVNDEVYSLELKNPDAIKSFVNIEGQLDLSTAEPVVKVQRKGEQERTLSEDEVYFVVEDLDPNAWIEIPREENEIVLLERTGTWKTNLNLVARWRETEDEIAKYSFQFAGTDTWFRHLRGGGHTWVYTDEIGYTIDLDMNHYAGMPDVNVEWTVGEFDDDTSEFKREAYGSKSYDDLADCQYVIDKDTTSISLNGSKLAEDFWKDTNAGVTVRAIVYSGNKELYQFNTWVELRHPVCRLDGEDDSELLYWEGTGWVYEQNTIEAWVENEHFPYGKNVTLYIEDMALENHNSENPAFTLYSHRASGYWNIYAEQPGGATVTFRLHHGYMGSFEISKEIYTSDEIYLLKVFSDTGSHMLYPGETINLITDFYKYTSDDKGNVEETYIPEDQYEISIWADDTDLLRFSASDKTVTAFKHKRGGTNVHVKVILPLGDEVVIEREYVLWMEVSDHFMTLTSEKYFVEPNSIHDIDKFSIDIVEKYIDENGELIVNTYEPDKVRFEDVGNYNYFWITWWNQKIAVNNKISRTLPMSNKVYVVAEHDGQQFEGWVNVVICEHNYQKKTMSAAGGATTTYDYCEKCKHEKNHKTFYLSKTSYTFNGSVQKPSVVVLDKDGKTLDSKYYSVSYPSGCKNAGTYKVTISFKGEYSGSETLSYSIGAKKITPAVTLSKTEFTYNGKTQTPTVTVKDGATKLTANTDYTVSYASGSKNVGKYTVKVTLKGNYSGTKSLTYTIIPKGTSVSKVTAASKAFTVKWKKQATQTTGYQIQYSTSKDFSGAKTVNVKGTSTVSKAVKKLKAKKKYYVRVRTYKTVSGVTYYSSWSGAKSIKTK